MKSFFSFFTEYLMFIFVETVLLRQRFTLFSKMLTAASSKLLKSQAFNVFTVHLDLNREHTNVLTAASVLLDITLKTVTVFLAQLVSRNPQMYFAIDHFTVVFLVFWPLVEARLKLILF